jgi:hypothetical protein
MSLERAAGNANLPIGGLRYAKRDIGVPGGAKTKTGNLAAPRSSAFIFRRRGAY